MTCKKTTVGKCCGKHSDKVVPSFVRGYVEPVCKTQSVCKTQTPGEGEFPDPCEAVFETNAAIIKKSSTPDELPEPYNFVGDTPCELNAQDMKEITEIMEVAADLADLKQNTEKSIEALKDVQLSINNKIN